MSRIGKIPIPGPDGVKVKVDGQSVEISGKNGTLQHEANAGISVTFDEAEKQIVLDRARDTRQFRALHGLNRSLVFNMVKGVAEGFEKQLEIIGTGYSAAIQGKNLVLRVGYSHPVEMPVPEGLAVEVPQASNPGRVVVRGADKQALGQFAADVRRVRPPEPYKGKGIKYIDEVIRRKAGKAFASAEA